MIWQVSLKRDPKISILTNSPQTINASTQQVEILFLEDFSIYMSSVVNPFFI